MYSSIDLVPLVLCFSCFFELLDVTSCGFGIRRGNEIPSFEGGCGCCYERLMSRLNGSHDVAVEETVLSLPQKEVGIGFIATVIDDDLRWRGGGGIDEFQ